MDQAPSVIGRAPVALPPGTMIAGKYRVDKVLGRGGFGLVVRAMHLTLEQRVAIKVLTEGTGSDEEWLDDAARFRREARATASLRGENVVRILDVDTLPSGSPYMVMEYLEGETLHTNIYARGALAVPDCVDHVLAVLVALAEAHGAGIVHRDLKPANVFLTRGKAGTVVKVLDFGVSKRAALSAEDRSITKTGSVLGTVLYMAPEQMVDAKQVDARADLWSVGIMLYEMLTRKTPFGPADAPNLVAAILSRPPMPISSFRVDVPRPLEDVILRTLEKTPDRRWTSATELGAALAPFATPRSALALETLRRMPRASGAAEPRAISGSLRLGLAPPRAGHSSPPPQSAPVPLTAAEKRAREEQIGVLLLVGLGAAALVFAVIALVTRLLGP